MTPKLNASTRALRREVTKEETYGHRYDDWTLKRLPATLEELCKWWRLEKVGRRKKGRGKEK